MSQGNADAGGVVSESAAGKSGGRPDVDEFDNAHKRPAIEGSAGNKFAAEPDWFVRVAAALDPDGTIRAALDAPRPAPAPVGELPADDVRIKRARAWLAKVPGAVQGQDGSGQTYGAACGLVHGFALPPDRALDLLLAEYNGRCSPPWSVRELSHKVDDAARKEHAEARGYLLARGQLDALPAGPLSSPVIKPTGDADRLEHDDDPHRIARAILAGYGTTARPTLAFWRGDFYAWDGSRWVIQDRASWPAVVNLAAVRHFEAIYKENQRLAARGLIEDVPKMGRVTRPLVSNVVGALEARTLLQLDAAPAWVRGATGPDPVELVPMRNGLLHLPTFIAGRPDAFLSPTPALFNLNALAFNFDPAAPEPAAWLAFLRDLWDDDPEPAELLQQWAGYLLTPDLSQQKALLLIGPPRAGKGTICKVLRALVGPANCCAPTLSALGDRFGLASLLGKSLAIMEDVRISSRSDAAAICDRILTISGGGTVDVDRKNQEAVTVQLATRFVMCTNEAPRLADSSGAFPNRLCILPLTKSNVGREDVGLADRLLAELPGIFLWAVAGWGRLRTRKRFSEVRAAAGVRAIVADVGSPILAFVRERCDVGPGYSVPRSELYESWQAWCREEGRKEPGTAATFGKDLNAAVPSVEAKRRGSDRDGRTWCYSGIRIKPLFDGDLFESERPGTSMDASNVEAREERNSMGPIGGALARPLDVPGRVDAAGDLGVEL